MAHITNLMYCGNVCAYHEVLVVLAVHQANLVVVLLVAHLANATELRRGSLEGKWHVLQ